MEMKLSSPSSRGLSPPDCASDPEEQEVSDEDDDDRNHKHRRRETRSQSLERDQSEQFMSRPYRKRSRPIENGHSYNQGGSQSNYNLEREIPFKAEKRRPTASFSRFSSDLNQRFNGNQIFPGDLGFGRGRMRDSSPWGQNDLRFTPVDVASPLIQPGSIPPAMFAGRGLPNVSNPRGASWGGGFGLLPGIPNGGIDTLHSLGLQGPLRPPLNPSLSMGIPRQRCRDFEERGFCLRGDMCPMEHGMNHIVVEDVQSLSQFNLPVSLPSAHMLGSAGSGVVPSVDASGALMSHKNLHGRTSKSGRDDDGYTLDGALPGVDSSGADVYDPDQPLWNSDCPETSTGLLTLQPQNVDQAEFLMGADPSDRMIRSSGAAVGLQSTSSSVWGRISSSKNSLPLKEKADSRVNSSELPENRTKEKQDSSTGVQGTTSHPRKRVNSGAFVDSSSKPQSDTGHSVRRSAPKALRTLFVSGIPLKDNKREALISHFRKFGEVIDIYIPSNTERAFVQFSKREEAERALKSPDAVMGNRFIKLWWANRDNVVDDGTAVGSNMPATPHSKSLLFGTAHLASACTSNDNVLVPSTKFSMTNASDSPRAHCTNPKTSIGPKASPPVLKKQGSLENLKEELRKKQEMLEHKRNELMLQLNKFQKQGTGVKGEVPTALPAAKQNVSDSPSESTKAINPKSSESQIVGSQSLPEGSPNKSQTLNNTTLHGSRHNLTESSSLKQGVRLFGQFGAPIPMNRYKLDNRPTSFIVGSPLPADFAKVNALRDHFASFGDLSNVELEDLDVQTSHDDDITASGKSKNVSARVCFKTRQAAERAFMNGKTWNGHSLKFTWITTSSNSSTSQKQNSHNQQAHLGPKVLSTEKPATGKPPDYSNGKESSSSAIKGISDGTQFQEKPTCDASEGSCGENGSSLASSGPLTGEAQSENRSSACSSCKEDDEPSRTVSGISENLERENEQKESIEGVKPLIETIEVAKPNEEGC